MANNEIRNPSKAYFKWKMPVITKSEDDWNFWNTEDKYNRTMFIGYNDTTTPHVASLFIIVDGKAMQAVGDDVIARIAGLETNTAQALADIQALIDRVNVQQGEISNLQQECQRILEDAESAVRAAQIWAEGTDAQVAEKGGEHSAKGWAQKANDIVAAGLPSDVTFDHLTVTSNSKFGQDPDRANQPGLEIESTGEIQAYRTVNMMNGATVSYDETVEMPWSDSSNKVPNTAWVQQAVQHGTIDPNTELTVKKITTTTGGGSFNYTKDLQTNIIDVAQADYPRMELSCTKYRVTVSGKAVDTQSKIQLDSSKITVSATAGMAFTASVRGLGNDSAYSFGVGGADADRLYFAVYPRAVLGHGLLVGGYNITPVALSILRDTDDGNNWKAKFYVTPTVPDITNAADSSDKVPNTKWVQAAIAAGGGGSGAVTSVNGKTGEVVLSATDVGAASSSDLASYVTTDAMNTELTNYATTASVATKLADYQLKLIAGDGIAISESNVISATGGTGGGAVSSVNGKTGEVVLNATDVGAITGAEADTKITTALEPYAKTADVTADITAAVAPLATTEALTTGLAGKQDKLTAESDLSVNNLTVNNITLAKGLTSETGTVRAKKIQTVADTAYDADCSFTRVYLRDIVTKSGTYGYVTLSGDEIRVNGKNSGKALTYLSADGIYDTTAKPAADASNTRVGTTAWVQSAINAKTANLQPKLTAGTGIAISADNVISATVSSPVDSVNGKTGAVVLSGEDIKLHPTAGEYTYPTVSDVIDSISGYLPDGVASDNKLVDNSSLSIHLAQYQPKLTAGEGITISPENVISATGGGSGAVTSVNGNTGAVVLTGDNIMTASDSTTSLNSALAGKQASITADTELTCKSVTTSYDSALNSINYAGNISFTGDSGNGSLGKITANELFTNASGYYGTRIQASGIKCTSGASGTTWFNVNSSDNTVSVDGTITATSPAVDANNNQVATTSWVKTALAGKQDSLTEASDLTVGSLTAGSADSGLYAGRYSIRFTSNGTDKLFVDATGPYVSNLIGGALGTDTGAFNWYINTTTDYNKFNVFNRYRETNTETGEINTYDTSVLSIGGSPDDHSTWIDFTATYMSFKGNTNFGETGMNHAMNFNGPSSFNNEASFHGSTHVFGNVTFWKSDAEGSTIPLANFDKSTGKFDIDYLTSTDGGNGANRVTIMADSREANYGAMFNLPVTVSDASFKRTSTLAADDNSTEVPTTAWVKAAIAAGGGGSVPDDITCKTLSVTDTGTVHILNVGDGKAGQKFNCNTDASFGYNVSIGWTSGRLKCMRDEYNWLFDFNRNASPGSMLKFNDTVTILSAMPAATDSSNKVPTTAWVQGAITANAATKPTLTYAENSGEPTVTKIEQCNGGSLCTIMWTGNVSTATGHVYIDLPSDFASAKIVSTQFTAHDTSTAAPWTADASISGRKIMLSVKSTAASSRASATIMLYKA